MSNVFHKLTVLSIEQATTLPYMTLRLAEDGARVIRLEAPPRGDPNRWVGPQVLPGEEGMNAYYLPNNLGKQSITLNLRKEQGREILHRLIAELPVDIFATNQRPLSYQKLGIDYSTLSAIKPDLIWVGITGFGPQSNEPAYDPILQARAGWMSLTGEADGDPTVFGLPLVDLGAGEHAYGQVMKALYQRAVSGQGARLDISMLQSAVSWMVSPVMLSHSFDVKLERRGNTHRFFAPVSVYPTADGYVYLAVGNDRQWEALTNLVGFTALKRPAYQHNTGRIANVENLNHQIASITRTFATVQLVAELHQIGVPVGEVNSLKAVAEDPLIQDKLIKAKDAKTGLEISIAPPPVISSALESQRLRLDFPPRLGEHNDTILGKLGFNIQSLKSQDIL